MATTFTWPAGRRAALSLSFDDARVSQIDHGLPILDAAGVRATFYVSFGSLEKRLDAWRQAAANGHELGNHTVHHPCSCNFGFSEYYIEGYDLAQMEAELLEANAYLNDRVGVKPQTFAYPCGQTYVGRGEATRSYAPLAAKHFLAARSYMTEYYNQPDRCDLALLGGFGFDGLAAEPLTAMLERAVSQGSWLVLAGHDIRPDHGHQIVNTEILKWLCDYCTTRDDIWLDTVAAVAGWVAEQRPD